MNDNLDDRLLEALVIAIISRTGMENTEHSVVHSARKAFDLIRKEQFNLAGEKFATGTNAGTN